MSRVIKFRAWHNGEGSMIDWDYIIDDGILPYFSSDSYILMQYTGLKDKDGREIYEGDVPDGIWGDNVVQWCEHCHGWSLGIAEIEGYCHQCEGDIMWLDFVADVIEGKVSIAGNIHENPELLTT